MRALVGVTVIRKGGDRRRSTGPNLGRSARSHQIWRIVTVGCTSSSYTRAYEGFLPLHLVTPSYCRPHMLLQCRPLPLPSSAILVAGRRPCPRLHPCNGCTLCLQIRVAMGVALVATAAARRRSCPSDAARQSQSLLQQLACPVPAK